MGFEEAGNGELVFAFLEQIQKADIQTTELNPGDTLEWMFFKKGRKVKVKKDVIYDGKKPVPAYTFTIFREGKTYEFIVPKICGNISLKNTQEIPAPVCALTVTPERSGSRQTGEDRYVRVAECLEIHGERSRTPPGR